MKHDNCKYKYDNLAPACDNLGMRYNTGCNMPVKRHLQPILVARVYYQPIVEEIPNSAMCLTLDNTATISNAYTDVKPICDDCCCSDGFNDVCKEVPVDGC